MAVPFCFDASDKGVRRRGPSAGGRRKVAQSMNKTCLESANGKKGVTQDSLGNSESDVYTWADIGQD